MTCFENFSRPLQGGFVSKISVDVCKTVPIYHLSLGCYTFGGDTEKCYKLEQECGVSLENISDTPETHEYLEAAKKTGSPVILSEKEAQRKTLANELVKDAWLRFYVLGNQECHRSNPEERVRMCVEKELDRDSSGIFEKLPRSTQAAIQNNANRFLAEARALVEKLRGGAK